MLRYAAGLNDGTTSGPCPDVGTSDIEAFGHPWGDLNCDDLVDALDALYLETYEAGIHPPQSYPCPAVGDPTPEDYNDLLLDIEREVPGFAGLGLNQASNTLQVWITHVDFDSEMLQASISARFPEVSTLEVEPVIVSYDWAQLMAWYKDVQGALYADPDIAPHITSTDIDEVRNRIVIGVETDDAKSAAEALVGTLDVPSDAVEIVIQAPPVPDIAST